MKKHQLIQVWRISISAVKYTSAFLSALFYMLRDWVIFLVFLTVYNTQVETPILLDSQLHFMMVMSLFIVHFIVQRHKVTLPTRFHGE